jgi:hypothetical protein
MNILKNKKILASHILLLASLPLVIACSDDNPFSNAEGNMEDIRYEASDKFYDSEENRNRNNSYDDDDEYDCRYGISSRSDSWCCSNYGYQCYNTSSSSRKSSSSSAYNYEYDYYSSSYRYSSSSENATSYDDEAKSYLYKDYTVEIDLTWFKQLTDNWEKQKKHEGDYSDGDPSISFVIKTYSDYTRKDSVKTDVFKLEDAGTWSGHEYFTKKFSGGANEIYICPMVFERNVIELNVDHSSYYCYIIRDAGKNVNTPIKQSDTEATDFELEWTVRISYN